MARPHSNSLFIVAMCFLVLAIVSQAYARVPDSYGHRRSNGNETVEPADTESQQAGPYDTGTQPFTSGDMGTMGQQPTGYTPSARGGEFNMSGGLGSGTASGSNGASPNLDFASLNMKEGTVYEGRASYSMPLGSAGELRFGADYLTFEADGTTGSYHGDPWGGYGTGVQMGDHVTSSLETTLYGLTVDYLVIYPSFSGLGALKLGPRIQYFIYHDTMKVHVIPQMGLQPALHFSQSRDYGVPGLGVAGSVGLDRVLGYPPGVGTFVPSVRFAGALSESKDMRYKSAEAALNLVMALGSGMTGPSGLNAGVTIELAYIFLDFVEKKDDVTPVGIGEPTRTDKADYRIVGPVVRAGLTF